MPSVIQNISDTARWVASYRAMESERPDALFRDPLARRLGGNRGEQIVRTMPLAATSGWVISVRTAVLDEFILSTIEKEGVDLVLNLAAGFDARPYRLPLPPTLTWVEVDLPGVLEEKVQLLEGETPHCRLERITADLSDVDARRAVFQAVGAKGTKALILTEGLLMYLADWQVASLASDLAQVPTFRLWAMDSIGPEMKRLLNLIWFRHLTSGNATFKFAPREGARFFHPFGWAQREYRSYETESRRLNRAPLVAEAWHRLQWLALPVVRELVRSEGGMALLESRKR
jgi:methyltransferase (TIGR00027 family)